MSSLVKLGAAACLAVVSCSVTADIWFTAGNSLYRLDPASNQPLLVASPGPAQALAVDTKDGSVWVEVGAWIVKVSPAGAMLASVDLGGIGMQNPAKLSVNPFDSNLWLADGKSLARVDAMGHLLGISDVPGVVRPLSLGVDEAVWILGNKQLWRYSPQGVLLASHSLASVATQMTKHLVVDTLGNALWLGGEKQMLQLDLSNPAQVRANFATGGIVSDLALDPKGGTSWILAQDTLLGANRNGAVVKTVELIALGISGAATLAYDTGSDSLWVGHRSGIARFTSSGEFATNIATATEVSAIGTSSLVLTPSVSIVRPPPNAITGNPRPEIRLAYDALCGAVSCGFAPDYFSFYTLDALLNNQSTGSLFAFDPSTGQASMTPVDRLPEGASTFSAQVRDQFGHLSAPATNTFTVDTVAPSFLSLTPVDGSVVQNANVVIQGTLDDPTATVALGGSGATVLGASFAFPVVLQPGLNSYVLSAVDPAGNVKSATLQLSLATVSVTISSPVSGATIDGDKVSVAGTFQGPINTGITVNGIATAVVGNSFIAASVPLAPGANTLTVTATTPNGQSATQTLSINSAGPAPLQISASPVQGIAPIAVTFAIGNATGSAIQSIRVDYTGTGTFVSVAPGAVISRTYTTPGTYQARFIVMDSAGNSYEQTVAIVVENIAHIDSILRAQWDGFMAALAAMDIANAVQYFNAPAKKKYGPVLSALQPHLPQIVTNFAPIQLSSLGGGVGEYAVKRTNTAGITYLYLIYFVQDNDGVWRLDTM